jgi:hypothetical protein
VVTMEKARKKTSQALRETKELKWLDIDEKTEKKGPSQKDVVCPFCQKTGHKTRIAKTCLFHHQWLDAGKTNSSAPSSNPESEAPAATSLTHSVHAPAKNVAKAASAQHVSTSTPIDV